MSRIERILIGLVLVIIGSLAIGSAVDASEVCVGLSSGKIDTAGDPATVTITATAGYEITGYCVKAGSSKQGDGPVYVTVDPPRTTIVIAHPSGKAVSHYSWTQRPITTPPTTQPPPSTTSPPPPSTTAPSTTVPPTLPPPTTVPPTVPTSTIPVTTTTAPPSTTTSTTTTVLPPPPPPSSPTPTVPVTETPTPSTPELPETGAGTTIMTLIAALCLIGLGWMLVSAARRP